jgi:hypothetical protein
MIVAALILAGLVLVIAADGAAPCPDDSTRF